MYDKSISDLPYFFALQKVAREIGVDPQTVVRNPDDFPRTILMGGQRYVAAATYRSWLRTRLSEASGEAARG